MLGKLASDQHLLFPVFVPHPGSSVCPLTYPHSGQLTSDRDLDYPSHGSCLSFSVELQEQKQQEWVTGWPGLDPFPVGLASF